MNLKNISDSELLSATRRLVQEERRLTLEILHHLREIDRRRLYAELKFSSLFDYCVKELGYAGGSAQRRIDSMRLLRELPEIEERIEAGTLNLSLISQACKFFRHEEVRSPEAKREVIEAITDKSCREAERELVSRAKEPAKLIPEKVRQISASHSELKLVVDQELLDQLEELKGLLGHQIPGASLTDLIRYSASLALKKHRVKPPKHPLPTPAVESPTKPESAPLAKSPERHPRKPTAEMRRQVWHRDGGRCTYSNPQTGQRCGSTYALEPDHRVPYAQGGPTTVENLRLRCRAHNQYAAIQSFGHAKMAEFIPSLK